MDINQISIPPISTGEFVPNWDPKKNHIPHSILILGNGFDLDLGIKTKYSQFAENKEKFGEEVYNCPKTIISKEYSTEWKDGMEPYYPVNDKENSELYAQYKNLADQEKDVIFGGRLAEYKYYDMAPIIEKALAMFK